VGEALLFGFIASSALIIGGVIGAYVRVPEQVTGIMLAFASGALISALAFELFSDAYELGGAWRAGLGLLAGAATFVSVNTWLDRKVAGSAKPDQQEKVQRAGAAGIGFPLLAAVTLDGVPENLALGVSLVEGASLTLLVAIFASNLPESLVGARAMRDEGRSASTAVTIWAGAAVLLTLAVVVGRLALDGVSENGLSVPLAFAGGAVLASLADTLMPEAFEHGRPWNSFATAAGFFVSFVLAGG
jgi:zinc transporter, ZIP family